MYKKIALFFIALYLLSTGCAYYNTFFNALKFYKEAELMRKEREKTEIVELSPEEIEKARRAGQSTQRGRSQASQKEMQAYQKSIERASRVLEYYPESKWVDDALMLLSKCFYYRRDYKRGLRKCDELMQNFPESEFVPEARLLKAKINIGLEEYETAVEQLRMLNRDKSTPKKTRELAKYELAGLYYMRRMYDLAAENYESTVRSADDKLIIAMATYRLGDCYIHLGQTELAPEYFKRAVKEAPNEDFLAQATIRLGQAMSMNGEYDRATKIFRNHLAKEYDEKRIPRVKFELAQNLRMQGNLQDAITWYENIIEEHKRTDASARSYFALGEIEEYINQDYRLAQQNYDMVRGEFQNSLIAPDAQERSDNIKTLLDLERDIAKLEGREIAADSLSAEDGNGKNNANQKDDAPISLSLEGMWVNYTGRDRPPPISLMDLTEEDLQRKAMLEEKIAQKIAEGDSTLIEQNALQTTQLDSAALAKRAAEEEANKKYRLSERYLALGEVFYFNFNKPDTAVACYQYVVDQHVDSSLTARALYSLAYLYREAYQDSVLANELLTEIVELFPETPHAEGARRALNLPLKSDEVDSAYVLFTRGENAILETRDYEEALQIWKQIVEDYPESLYAAKAAYTRAWHLERSLYDKEKAMDEYKLILETFPETSFAETVQAKLDAMEKAIEEEEARKKAIADSLEAIANGTLVPGDSTGAAMDSLAMAASDSASTLPDSLQPAPQEPQSTASTAAAMADSLDTAEQAAETEDEELSAREKRKLRRQARNERLDPGEKIDPGVNLKKSKE